uniref:Uncharacterized protein n=2 Tax=Avena sativa TaxID=4498 RepID=A0ACD5Y7S5_AVESA
MGHPVPALPKNPEDSTYGQFAIVPLTNGPTNLFCAFFVKDPSRLFDQNHDGVQFNSHGRVRVHVCVFGNGGWVPHIFDSLALSSSTKFQRSPYSIQAGYRTYIMYLIGLIVCFDVEQGTFKVVALPRKMGMMIKGCFQYTIGPHPQGDLPVVHVDNGMLVKWVLTRVEDMSEWNQEASVDLVVAFRHMISTTIWEALLVQPSDCRAIQV